MYPFFVYGLIRLEFAFFKEVDCHFKTEVFFKIAIDRKVFNFHLIGFGILNGIKKFCLFSRKRTYIKKPPQERRFYIPFERKFYFKISLNKVVKAGEEGLSAFALTIFPFGSIRIKRGIPLIP